VAARAGLLIGALALAGCDDVAGGALFDPRAPAQVRVVHDTIAIVGPAGFCIDPRETRDGRDGAFVLLAGCASITRSPRQPKPGVSAILTATVAGEESSRTIAGSTGRLKTFFTSSAGRAALSRSGKADSVKVLETAARKGVFYIHARDSSGGARAGAGADYWRAMLDVGGRIVSVSLLAVDDHPVAGDEGFATLQSFVGRIRAANRPDPAAKGSAPLPAS